MTPTFLMFEVISLCTFQPLSGNLNMPPGTNMSCLAHPGSGKRSSLTSDLVGSPPPKSSTAHRLNTPRLKKLTALSPWAHQWVNMLFRAFSVCKSLSLPVWLTSLLKNKQLKNSCVFSIRVQIILFDCSQPDFTISSENCSFWSQNCVLVTRNDPSHKICWCFLSEQAWRAVVKSQS